MPVHFWTVSSGAVPALLQQTVEPEASGQSSRQTAVESGL